MHTTNFFHLLILIEGISSVKVTTEPEINITLDSDTPVVLNCTYSTDINVRSIKWQKSIDGHYQTLADFVPGGGEPLFGPEGIYLRNRSTLINPGNGSTSAVLKINDVRCEDDGRYRCLITYPYQGVQKKNKSDTFVFLQVGAEQPNNFSINSNAILKEKDVVNLSCSANVGNPDGFVAIWKLNNLSSKPVFLNKSSLVEKTENCTTTANLNITYSVTRDDNGAVFRCTSQNRQTKEPAPYEETKTINVYYGPSNVSIQSSSQHQDLYIGANINLTCSSDGNPVPTFKWKFNSVEILSDDRHSFTLDNRTLILREMVFNDSGIYSCFASNLVDEKTSNLSLNVKEIHKEDLVTFQPICGENSCKVMETCSEKGGKAVCTVNHWFSVTLVFISLTLIFMITTAFLCRLNSSHNNNSIHFNGDLKCGEHSRSQTNDCDLGGYTDPKDVTKLCQNTKKNEAENEAYADPVDNQYASVQKDPQSLSNPPNVYDGAWV